MNPSGYADLLNTSFIDTDYVVIGTLVLPNLDPNSVPYIDSSNTVQDRILNNGQLLVGKTGLAPVAASLTGTTDEVVVTNGPGTITLSTPQPIATTSSPTFSNITITNNVAGPTNTRTADNIVSNTSTGVLNNIASFVSDKVIKDSGVSASTGPWLPLAGGTMTASTGTINMNSSQLTNVSLITPATTNILIGSGVSAINASNIVLGNSSTNSASGPTIAIGNSNTLQSNCNNGVLVGNNVTLTQFGGMTDSVLVGSSITSSGGSRNIIIGKSSSNGTGDDNVIVGEASSITSTGVQNVVVGANSTLSGNGGVSIGYGNTVGGSSVTVGAGNACTATRAHSFGLSVSNSTANSVLLDARTNVRCDVDNLTDLGTSSQYWKDGYFKGSLRGGTNSRTCDNIVSNAGTGVLNNVCAFTSDKVIKDGGISISSITGGPFLPTAGGTMLGVLAMGSNNITGTGTVSANIFSSAGTTDSTTTSTGSITTAGGIGAAKNIWGLNVNSAGTTDSTTTSTGSITSAGGIAAAKNIWGLNVNSAGTTDSTTTSTGSITSAGGIAAAKNIYGLNLNSAGTTDSTTTSTGSITSAGGIGVAKAVNIGTTLGVVGITTTAECVSSLPTCYMSFNEPIASISFTANVAQSLDLGTFTELMDPTNSFTSTASTGKITYNGTPTRYFKIDCIYEMSPPANTQSITIWVTKNASSTAVGRNVHSFTTAALSNTPYCVSTIYQLATTNTIQLWGNYSLTASITFFSCKYIITPIC